MSMTIAEISRTNALECTKTDRGFSVVQFGCDGWSPAQRSMRHLCCKPNGQVVQINQVIPDGGMQRLFRFSFQRGRPPVESDKGGETGHGSVPVHRFQWHTAVCQQENNAHSAL